MNGDTNNIEQHAPSRPMVTSIGNAWVVCDSKSRPGYKYYFDTQSGESVWNLSPEDIVKAKKYTKGFPRSEIEKYPEPPIDPSMDPPNNFSRRPPMQYFNNQNLQLPNQISNLMPIPPNVAEVNSFILNNAPPNNAGQTQPIIYVVHTSGNIQSSREPNNLYINNYERNETDLRRIMNYRDVITGNRSNNNDRFTCTSTGHRSNWHGNRTDLRQKLTRKRSLSVSSGSNMCDRIEETHDVGNRNNMIFQSQLQEETSKYDLSVLDQLKSANTNATNWFIVVDTEILLKNFKFLNKLCDPDQNCYLYIPDHVMSELTELVSSSSDMPTRRILRFITEQIQSGLAFKGDVVSNAIDDSHKLLATCQEVAAQSNVILLSNDIRLEKIENDHKNIHILTMNQLNQLLNEEHKSVPTRMKSPTLGIKIVVTNDNRGRATPSKSPYIKVQSHTPKKKDLIEHQSNQQTSSSLSKPVQNSELNSCPKENNPRPRVRALNFFEKHSEEIEKLPQSSQSENEGRKEIKLFRNPQITGNTENSQNIAETRYRWRRQKSSTSTNNASKSTCSDQAVMSEPIKQQEATNFASGNQIAKSNSIILPPIMPNQMTRDPSLDRSSLSSHKKRNERQNITIEETSTSGVISNTTLDSESFNCNRQPKADSLNINQTVKETVSKLDDDVEFVKFEVVGQSMEEVLKIRREEWVLRFVQIMEEMLREVLREDSTFQSKDYNYMLPWPTDLPELSRCVIKKFNADFNVVDAANRLCLTLRKISDNKGNISPNIEPGQYMDMYSFGVYLVEALKRVSKNIEDLVTTEGSLKQLLFDIQNANQETIPNDSFLDEMSFSQRSRCAVKTTEQKDTEQPQSREFFDYDIQNCEEERNERNSNKSNSISPHKQNPAQGSQELQQRQLTTIESKFFSSLALTQIPRTEKAHYQQNSPCSTPNSARIAQTPPQVASSPKTPQTPPINLLKINPTVQEQAVDINKNKEANDNDIIGSVDTAKDNVKTNPPVIIRNFASIPQFEEKLKKRSNFTNEPQAMDEEFVEDDYDYDENNDEYYDENEEYVGDNEPETGANEELEEGEIAENETTDTANFQYIMKEFTDEIRQALKLVEYICRQLIEELKKSSELSSEMQLKLKFVSALTTKAKTQINSVLKRDSTMSENNLVGLLKKACLDNYVPDDEVFTEYKNTMKGFEHNLNGWCHILSQIMESVDKQVD